MVNYEVDPKILLPFVPAHTKLDLYEGKCLVSVVNVYDSIDFFSQFAYTNYEIGGVKMNQFEKDVQTKRNDVVDSGVGFIAAFGFFALIFIIGTVVKLIGV